MCGLVIFNKFGKFLFNFLNYFFLLSLSCTSSSPMMCVDGIDGVPSFSEALFIFYILFSICVSVGIIYTDLSSSSLIFSPS